MISKGWLLIGLCVTCILATFSVLDAASLNVSGVIRDSLSHDSLPMVKVTVVEFGKSFITKRSSFYIALKPSTYTITLEADAYEIFTNQITVTTEGQVFTFDMVKLSDRAELNKRSDSLYLYQHGFQNAITNLRIPDAYAYMVACKRYAATDEQLDSMMLVYNSAKVVWVDSVFQYAQALEDSQKISDAYFYFKKILSVDSLHEGAKEHLGKTENMLTTNLTGSTQSANGGGKGTSPTMTREQIEATFNQAVNKFLEEDYQGALVLLKTVLKNDPNHEGAKNYLSRTQARLQIK